MSEVERLCDDVICCSGRVFDRGSPRELIERFGRETWRRFPGHGAAAAVAGSMPCQEGDGVVSGSAQRIWASGDAPLYIWRSS